MLALLPATLVTFALFQSTDVEVVSVNETKVFAGKLGNRVTRTMTVRKDGKLITINLPTYHDRFHPLPKR